MNGPESVDLLVIGGGINGAGIARDAAGRGLSVMLVEAEDLASATSSASSKLIHGGLRYLEYYEFRLVREALIEREVLLKAAPHIIWPLRFVLPHHKGLRPAWMLRAGLFLYDHLGGRQRLPGTRKLRLDQDPAGAPLRPEYRLGFEYSDCWVEDSRLVVLNAVDAAERGATILTRTRLVAGSRTAEGWLATLEGEDGGKQTVRARAIVNAAGPWVGTVQGMLGGRGGNQGPRLVKGSHIVVPKLHDGPHCYTFQNADGRIVFMIPYERDFTLIGTTDVPYQEDPRQVAASDDEVAYLCAAVSDYIRKPVSPADVVWRYAGVRPLYDDGESNASAVTRDYVFDLDRGGGDDAPLLSIYGGKITTFRRLAEHALEQLAPLLGNRAAPWTDSATLPGGDMPCGDFDAFLADTAARYPAVPAATLRRWARAYGTRLDHLAQAPFVEVAPGVTEAELTYLWKTEWARTGADVLWRRSKLGLHLTPEQQALITQWFAARPRAA
jgi:glycerol-3-phosphate dehydrogenase